MGQDEEGFVSVENLRYFSLKNDFPDQWYALHNPVEGLKPKEYADWKKADFDEDRGKPLKPYAVVIDLRDSDFLPNEDRRRIRKLSLALAEADRHKVKDPKMGVKISYRPDGGKWKIDAIDTNLNLSPERPSDTSVALNGRDPAGRWVFEILKPDGSIAEPSDFDPEWLQDLLLIIEYKAKVHYGK